MYYRATEDRLSRPARTAATLLKDLGVPARDAQVILGLSLLAQDVARDPAADDNTLRLARYVLPERESRELDLTLLTDATTWPHEVGAADLHRAWTSHRRGHWFDPSIAHQRG